MKPSDDESDDPNHDGLDEVPAGDDTGARRYGSKPMSRSFGEVTISEIVVPADRMRQEMDGKAEGERLVYLRVSMAALGLIHPISITKDKVLVVGERRLICARRNLNGLRSQFSGLQMPVQVLVQGSNTKRTMREKIWLRLRR